MCSTSGWNCTPAKPRPRSSNAATGAPSVVAVTANPGGAADTESPCDIHTRIPVAGSPSNNADLSAVTVSPVRPNSDSPVFSTVPPSASAMAWKP